MEDCFNDPAHESDMRQLMREQLRLDVDLIDCDESVPYEPRPLEELVF